VSADDRALRDRLEKLQVSSRSLRAQLDDPEHLSRVRAEIKEKLGQVQDEVWKLQKRCAEQRATIDGLRYATLEAKRLRSERAFLHDVLVVGRLIITVAALAAAGWLGLHYGRQQRLPLAGLPIALAGAALLITAAWRVGTGLRRKPQMQK
jgi:hypothetical protein